MSHFQGESVAGILSNWIRNVKNIILKYKEYMEYAGDVYGTH